MTTVCLIYLATYAIMNPNSRIAILLHKDDKAKEKLRDVKDILAQLGFKLRINNERLIILENGTHIETMSAGLAFGPDQESKVLRRWIL